VRPAFAILALASLAACGDAPMPTVEERPGATESPEDCVDQFVQVYEESTPDVPPQDVNNMCFDSTPPAGPPRFPSRSRKVTLEYDNGDYYIVQESVSWWLGDPDLSRGCGTTPRLKHERIVEVRQGGVRESSKTEDGETKRSAQTGDQYGSGIHKGSGPGWMATTQLNMANNPVSEVLREESPFGTCLRATVVNSTICSLEQGRSCNSYKTMLPIEVRVPNALGGGTQVGRTTSLERVRPDRSGWVLR
jgi:hypothetical protein